MAFLDKLSKTITNTGKDVAKKTKDLTETAKINSQISSEQKKIEDVKAKIGNIYYSQYKYVLLENLIPLCNELDEAYEKIELYKAQIIEIKGIVSCPNCGAELTDESSFCSKCGTKIEKPVKVQEEFVETEKILKCPNCQSEITEEVLFCTKCGVKLKE